MRVLVLVALLAAPLGAASYVSDACAFRLEQVPDGWEVVASGEPCRFVVRPENSAGTEDLEAVTIELGPRLTRVFSLVDGRWMISSRGKDIPAYDVEINGMRGVRGSAYAVIVRPDGTRGGLSGRETIGLCSNLGRCVFVSGFEHEMVATIAQSFRFTGRTYVSGDCAFRFEIPAGYEVASRDTVAKQHCAVTLRPVGRKREVPRRDVEAVTVATTYRPFEEAAAAAWFFRDEAGWMLAGHSDSWRATTVVTEKWNGLRGSSTRGCWGERLPLGERCISHRAALQVRTPDGDGRILLLTANAPGAKAIDAIAETFEFTGLPSRCERDREPDAPCAAIRFRRAEEQLARVAKLDAEQREWRDQRERECAKESRPAAADLCLERLTLQRIMELETR